MTFSAPLIWSSATAIIVAILGGLLTDVGPWYRSLRKSRLNPPDWLFGPAWTVIYILTVTAFLAAWEGAISVAGQRLLISVFLVNATLNIAWSALFFRIKRPGLALFEVGLLWASVLALILACMPMSQIAVVYLVPYLLWVTFAGYLNLRVVRDNHL
ncbi:MAG: TspO/MBR family protein [Pseudomonadota bacterium]